MRKSHSLFATGLCVLIGVLATSPALAWVETGHRIIALMIWDELTPTSRTQLTEILKQHPRYNQDLLDGLPQGSSEPETDRYAFTSAAVWPDLVRAQNNPMHFVANHPEWHYIDMPYKVTRTGADSAPSTNAFRRSARNRDNAASRPTSAATTAPIIGPANILQAIPKCLDDLSNSHLPPGDRAQALCWVLHLIGDLHQPLHACTMFSRDYPEGDRGGNSQVVLRDPPFRNTQTNLHLLWDTLPGNYKSAQIDVYMAAGLRGDPAYSHDRLADMTAIKDIKTWANESHDLAIKYVYLDGALRTLDARDVGDPQAPIPGVPEGYISAAEKVAMLRCVLAAYRAADVLNAAFPSK